MNIQQENLRTERIIMFKKRKLWIRITAIILGVMIVLSIFSILIVSMNM